MKSARGWERGEAPVVKVDRSAWGRLAVTGSDRERFLQGLTTVNVPTLVPGGHSWGAILSPKGRVLSVIDIARSDDRFVVSCEPALAEPTRALLERYAVMDDVAFESITGPAHQVWTDAMSVWTSPVAEGPGDAVDGDAAVERLRIRAGFPRYGTDVDDDHFPFETPLAKLLDYGKGCYVGQEPVFRVHAQGQAARALRGLEVAGRIAAGASIKHPAKDTADIVTSALVEGDVTLALGYLHRTCWEPSGIVEIDGHRATVHELPW
jgi:folate-binding protein YgfZ